MSKASKDHYHDSPDAIRNLACVALARAALFPNKMDWSGKHRNLRPALQALDSMRQDIVDAGDVPYSKLFPRHVILVPSPSGGMQWNGQPDIVNSTIEVIPNKLSVTAMKCSGDKKGVAAFLRNREFHSADPKQVYQEIVLCSNNLLKSDYTSSSDPTLLEQRRDFPPHSMAVVEESLAHQITKIREASHVPAGFTPCQKLAFLEAQAARLAECLYEKDGNEVYRGSALKPPGFSLLPKSLQANFQNRCVHAVAREATTREFGWAQGKKCVSDAIRAKRQ